MRSLLLSDIDQASARAARPRLHSTPMSHCAAIVAEVAQRIVGVLRLDWRPLASGHLPEYLHTIDGLLVCRPANSCMK